MGKNFDFQNMDIKLYLALKKLTAEAVEANSMGMHYIDPPAIEAAELAMEEFELSHGPLPEWAVSRNWDYSLVPGAQLCTKDGRRTGNAHIVSVYKKEQFAPENANNYQGTITYYECLTDAGSKFTMSEPEILEAFTIGDWVSDPIRVLTDFDREGHFDTQGE